MANSNSQLKITTEINSKIPVLRNVSILVSYFHVICDNKVY